MNYRFLFQTKNVDEEIYYSPKKRRVVGQLNGCDGSWWCLGPSWVIKIPAPHVTVLRLVVSGLTSVIRAHSVWQNTTPPIQASHHLTTYTFLAVNSLDLLVWWPSGGEQSGSEYLFLWLSRWTEINAFPQAINCKDLAYIFRLQIECIKDFSQTSPLGSSR